MLRLNGVFAGYGGGDVLQGVDIEVERGSVSCIVGPNDDVMVCGLVVGKMLMKYGSSMS